VASLMGRAAIVTGASRGIGRAIADRLASEGMLLVLGYLEHEEQGRSLATALEASGHEVVLVHGDVTDPETAQKLVDSALGRFGRLDCVVNNAGVTRDALFRTLEAPDYREVLDVNLVGAAMVARAATEPMIAAGFGRIVNIASFVGQKGNLGQANYAASKAGLIAWTKVAALELARHGITVNAVCPGFTETDMLKAVPSDVRDKLLQQVPLRRFGQPPEIADAVAFALSGDYMTGAQININGGIYM
jgi:NAD(P)-dependent dehydrogenase (short-subunit alcohol dehydrogenase family)